ncbi:circadian clock KaiB family protein [Mucilaginibacter celer]|uniref:Circadian clock protein KaiB n=1 Tax=Mucilaginibacter celer TaxID=2305508 RepID=A0A494VMS2_9SPHI|nr:circadian clock KaiB family protein [Mucilaginibacter celer]AYL95944.1 circadian clock protein KaiB [Mucilaginibacter celer]
MTEPNQLPLTVDDANGAGIFRLRLFITGASPNSTRAVINLKDICEKYLKDNYALEIIDVYQQPSIAQTEQIIALPLLVKKTPGMERRLIGDMSDVKRVLRGLGIYTED